MKRIVVFALLLISIAGCVPNRKYVYLQNNDLSETRSSADTTVVREYDLKDFHYTLQAMDNLYIRFESLSPPELDFLTKEGGQVQMSNSATAYLMGELVDEHGEIEYPVVGKVKVSGLTIFEAQQKLTELAKGFLQSPKVVIRLSNGRATVLGDVVREGVIPFNNIRLSILEVIGFAGGFGEFADRANVKLIRQHEGHAKVYYLNFLEEQLVTSPLYYANQGDVIVVPPLKQRPFRRYFGQNLALVVSAVTLLLLTYNIVK